MTPPRKMSFQLTPLLDLLLIVLFAQFLDVRGESREAEERYEAEAVAAKAAADSELVAGRRELAAAREELAAARSALAERRDSLAAEEADLETAKAFLAADRAELVAAAGRAASRMAKLFDIPGAVAREAFKVKDPPAVPANASDAARLRDRLEKLAERAGRSVVEHVLTYDELLKRADVWRVRVADDGRITFAAGETETTFRAATVDAFVNEATDAYRTLPEPKGLVIVTLSYGDARADVREAAVEGLDRWLEKLRDERLGRTQFAPAILGYVPEELTDGPGRNRAE